MIKISAMLRGAITRLKPVDEKDLVCYRSWIADPDLARLVLGAPSPDPEKQAEGIRHERCSEHNLLYTIETLSGKPVGFCFLRNMHPIHRFAELEQFFIGEERMRKHGYGEDAVRTLIRHCFGKLWLNRIWLITYAYNFTAIRFYEKCGFRREGLLRQVQFSREKYHDGVIMAILRQDRPLSPRRPTCIRQTGASL